MWPAWVVAGIALAGASFMVRFLVALLREGAPSVCYWVVPVRREPKKEGHLKALRGIYFEDDCPVAESDTSAGYLDLENEDYAKEKNDSGLVVLAVRPVSASLGWRSIHPRRGNIFREHRI
jgi:hypothetical protein